MFQFSGSPHIYLFIQYMLTKYCFAGFPHSEICGSIVICTFPQLIAACHVLLRLLMPRHSPCALLRLTSSSFPSLIDFMNSHKVSSHRDSSTQIKSKLLICFLKPFCSFCSVHNSCSEILLFHGRYLVLLSD